MFDWKFTNVVMGKIVERHYKCKNTGSWKCEEYKNGGGLKDTSYCLPDSQDYSIKNEIDLQIKLSAWKTK